MIFIPRRLSPCVPLRSPAVYFLRSRFAFARARVEYGTNAAVKLLPVINATIDRCAAVAFSVTIR